LLPDAAEDDGALDLDAAGARDPRADLPASAADPEIVARLLLRRYGVVGKVFLARERVLPPWQALLRVFRTLEARGEIRGGRFVAGFAGEQFALPEAIATLRSVRREGPKDSVVILSSADPLNLLGIVTPGERIPASATSRVAWLDGVPIAVREGSLTRWLVDPKERLSPELARRMDAALVPSRVDVRRQVLTSDTPSLAATGAMPRGRRPLRPLPGTRP
jgi:ATP-dependent Lhr-like helicase